MIGLSFGVSLGLSQGSSVPANLANSESANFNAEHWTQSGESYTKTHAGFSRLGFDGMKENTSYRVQFDFTLTGSGRIRLYRRNSGANDVLYTFRNPGSKDLTVDALDYRSGETFSLWFDDNVAGATLSNIIINEV